MRFAYLLTAVLTFFCLTACDQDTDSLADTALLISGKVNFEPNQSIPSGTLLTLRLENLSSLPDSDAVIAEQETKLEQQQKTIAFQLRAFRDQLKPDTIYNLRALIQTPDHSQSWTSDQLYLIGPEQTESKLGTISLVPVNAGDADNVLLFACGDKTIKAYLNNRQMQLQIKDDVYHLKQVTAASGAKYQSEDQLVVFWNKGQEAVLSMADINWPACSQVSEALLSQFPFQAQGNEPGWSLSANVSEVSLDWNYGQQHLLMAHPQLDITHSGFVLRSEADERLLRVNVLNSLCRDSMSGRLYPQHVDVDIGDLHLSGCGGDSQDLLTGKEWVVEDIDQKGIIDASRITMQFDNKGRLSGLASCNQYTTAYEFNESLDIAAPISTRKACAPALMNQENRFLTLLDKITEIDFDEKGALLLSTADGSVITARR